MFNRHKKDPLINSAEDRQDVPDWEEVELGADNDDAIPQIPRQKSSEDETPYPLRYSFRNDGSDGMTVIAGDRESIRINDEDIAIGDFPALRMAFRTEQPAPEPEEADALAPENGASQDMDELIRRYARMDEEEEPEQIDEEPVQEEELPDLFRAEQNSAGKFEEELETDEPRTVFTMESELQLQREISGELFEYIDSIKLEAEDLIRRRARDRVTARQATAYDPYNLHFNNRYDDTEDILESTPEISMEPKYRMDD